MPLWCAREPATGLEGTWQQPCGLRTTQGGTPRRVMAWRGTRNRRPCSGSSAQWLTSLRVILAPGRAIGLRPLCLDVPPNNGRPPKQRPLPQENRTWSPIDQQSGMPLSSRAKRLLHRKSPKQRLQHGLVVYRTMNSLKSVFPGRAGFLNQKQPTCWKLWPNLSTIDSVYTVCNREVRMRVQLIGPMTGLPGYNHRQFHEAAAMLREWGHEVFNPAETAGGDTTLPRSYYMRATIAALLETDMVALLPGWRNSKGARLEYEIACELGLPWIQLGGFEDDHH